MKHLRILILIVNVCFLQKMGFSQENNRTTRSCVKNIELDLWIHQIKSKSDVEKIEKALKETAFVKFVEVRDFPQQFTSVIMCEGTMPDDFNKVLKPLGFYITTPSFTEVKLIENDLKESRESENKN